MLRTAALLSLATLVAVSVYLIRAMEPPAPLPTDAPVAEFSAGRAFRYVREIGREPHAMGTPAHAQVRSYLLEQMRLLGLNPQVQETTVAHRKGAKTGYVYNLIGRRRGTKPAEAGGKAVLMLAHYDSQPNARGAADDGSSVAAILETSRALQQGPPLQNDVIFLITDGEEYGLFGAAAFLRHPWAKDVGFVMNLEARGVRGPVMTFEISPENGWAVEAFAKAAPYPVASSLMYEIYRVLPNSTDFTIYRDAGYTGINSAYIDGFVHYHKLTDSPENLDLGSLQHHGSNLLAMTRYVGNQPLAQTKAPDKVFFNTVGFQVVQYPMGLNGWLMALLTLVVVGTFVVGVRRGVVRVGQTLVSALAFVLIVLVVVGLFWPVTSWVRGLLPPAFGLPVGAGKWWSFEYYINGIYGSDRFLVAYALLTVGLFGLFTRVLLRWVRQFSLVMGVYLVIYGLVWLALLTMPSATYLLLFPLLFSALGTLAVWYWQLNNDLDNYRQMVVTWLAALPTLTLIPLVRMLFVTFDLQMPFIGAVFLLGLALGLLLPVALTIDFPLRWRKLPVVALSALLLGIGLTAWAVRAEQPSTKQPLHSMVSYYLDAHNNKAYWASASKAMDPWKQQFFARPTTGLFIEFYPAGQRTYSTNMTERLISTAPTLPLPAPTATVLSDSSTATIRTLRLRLQSVRGAAGFEVRVIGPDSAAVQQMAFNGESVLFTKQPVGQGRGYQFFTGISGLPISKTVTLTIQARPNAPLQLFLYDESMALPTSLVRVPRPADVVYEQGQGSNQTVVRRVVSL